MPPSGTVASCLAATGSMMLRSRSPWLVATSSGFTGVAVLAAAWVINRVNGKIRQSAQSTTYTDMGLFMACELYPRTVVPGRRSDKLFKNEDDPSPSQTTETRSALVARPDRRFVDVWPVSVPAGIAHLRSILAFIGGGFRVDDSSGDRQGPRFLCAQPGAWLHRRGRCYRG